jgi:hypothetical protein
MYILKGTFDVAVVGIVEVFLNLIDIELDRGGLFWVRNGTGSWSPLLPSRVLGDIASLIPKAFGVAGFMGVWIGLRSP